MINPIKALISRWRRAKEMESLTDNLHAVWAERASRPLSIHEKELLANALAFSERTAKDVCISRSEIVAVSARAGFTDAIKTFVSSNHGRLPVFHKTLDDLIGFITLKDMARFISNPADFKINDVLHPPVFVPETMPVPRVLHLMRRHRVGLVIVTDEYGGTSGLLTLKDLLGELVGDITDEHAEDDTPSIQSLGGGRFRVPASLPLDHVAKALGFTWPHTITALEIETLNGLLLHEAHRVPAVGENLILSTKLNVKILTGNARRVDLVEVTLPTKGGKA